MPDESPSTSNPKWLTNLLNWPNIRVFIELAVFVSAFLHLIPHNIEENLKETCLGVIGILGVIIVFALFENSRQSKIFSDYYQLHDEVLFKKNNEIISLTNSNVTLVEEVKTLTNYSRIFTLTNKAFAQIRKAHREDLRTNNEQKLKGEIKEFCNTLHEIFLSLKGSENKKCHVCIKIFVQPKQRNPRKGAAVKVKVITFMRDGRGDGSRYVIDDKKEIDHFVDDNYDYLEILEQSSDQNKRHFMSNDLLLIDDYKNSSLKMYNKDSSSHFKYAHASMEEKLKHWKLDYRSVLVGSICPGTSKPNFQEGTFIGMICVDYNQPNVFTQADTDIVVGFAEGLYETLNHYITTYFT